MVLSTVCHFTTPRSVFSSHTKSHAIQTRAANSKHNEPSVVMVEDFANSLETAQIIDLNGKTLTLTDLWKDRKVVAGFARHFGCVLCRKRADILSSQKSRMDACGTSLVLIGPGNIDQDLDSGMMIGNVEIWSGLYLLKVDDYPKGQPQKAEVYADPDHSTYDAFKFVSGILTTFTPTSAMRIIDSYREGYKQDWGLSLQRETVNRGGWQQGGIVVAGPGANNILYLHRDKEAGDDPDIEDIMTACCNF